MNSNAQIVAEILRNEGLMTKVIADNALTVWLSSRKLTVSEASAVLYEIDDECIGWKAWQRPDGVMVEVWETEPEPAQEPTPDPSCPHCQGTGEVYDYVPWGNTVTPMPSGCSCLEYREDE